MPSESAVSTERAARARRYVEASKAENTRRAYQSHLNDFREFCAERGYGAVPATPAAVVDYLTFLADIGAAMSTIQVKASAISYAHRIARLDNPLKAVEVQETLHGIRRTIGMFQKGKAPLTLAQLQQLLNALPEGLRGVRDKAILLCGFGGAFRRSELVALSISDIKFEQKQATVRLRQSKTDQEGHGMTKVLPVLDDKALCPVTALRQWLRAASITEGVVFRPIDRHGHVANRIMNAQEIARLVKKYAVLAGLDSGQLAGHSLRAGFVTEAANRSQPLWKIKQQTGHKSDAIVQRYIRDQGRGAGDATRSAFGEQVN